VIVYLIVIMGLYRSVFWGQLGQVLIKVVFEEVLFRLIMLGVMKRYLNLLNLRLVFVALIVNSLFFTTLHMQYETVPEYATIFFQSINFGLTYLSLGIIPSIANHLHITYREEKRIKRERIKHLK